MKVKLVIWDLDDTLWSGTLAEKDDLKVDLFRQTFIRESNNRGIVNSICSKNNFEDAKKELESLGLWKEFVFPRIEFSPKGQLVKWIIDSMQLRAENTIFIDDNMMNLKEVEHFCLGITTLNANDDSTNEFLSQVLEDNKNISKNRIEEYRILERKLDDKVSSGTSTNEEFLRTCGIKITLVRRAENLPFAERIEEIVNRTNQLNFTKNRIEEGSMTDYILDVDNHDTYSVFVWDKYGIYGLAGFFSIERRKICSHFLFSCRTMNMGIEQFLYQKMQISKYLKIPELEENLVDWIQIISDKDFEFQNVLEKIGKNRQINTHIMANCQSGVISHYLDPPLIAHIDNWPRVFALSGQVDDAIQQMPHNDAKNLIYGAFNDYNNIYWKSPPSIEDLSKQVNQQFKLWQERDLNVITLIPPKNIPPNKFRDDLGVTNDRVQKWNEVFIESSQNFGFECWEIDDFVYDEADVIDVRHYQRIVFERIGAKINSFFNQ